MQIRSHTEAAAALEELRRRRALVPLAYSRLWHREPPRTSQRAALQAIAGPDLLLLLVGGGNRAGKSLVLGSWGVACAAGRDARLEGRWWVREWLEANELPPEVIPGGKRGNKPAIVWVGSETFGAAVEQIRPILGALVPAGSRFKAWDDKRSEGEIHLLGGGRIVSKAYQQYETHPQSWEGAGGVRAICCDEEPPADCLRAGMSRLTDLQGRAMIALTPLQGRGTSLYREIVAKAPSWFREVRIHGADNPHIDQPTRRAIVGTQAAWQRASRDRGEWSDPEGRIWPWDPNVHLIDPLEILPEWPRWQGVDFGSRAPHVLWAAEDASQDRIVVYREYAPRRTTTEPGISDRQLWEEVRRLEAAEPEGVTIYRVGDSESPGAILEAATQGLWVAPAAKGPGSVRDGLQLVESMLQTTHPVTGEPQRPRLVVVRGACPKLQEEIEGLRWAPPRPGRDPEPDPSCPDHGPDALRYLVQYRRTLGYR